LKAEEGDSDRMVSSLNKVGGYMSFATFRRQIQQLRDPARQLLHGVESEYVSCGSLVPLGLALAEMAQLFEELLVAGPPEVHALFDGGETNGPNLDTRLKYIRDLCSASSYAVRGRIGDAFHAFVAAPDAPVESPGESAWLTILSEQANYGCHDSVVELARLLDDTFEAGAEIANSLGVFVTAEPACWNEVLRNLHHIRDHFDCAETLLIACMRPSKD